MLLSIIAALGFATLSIVAFIEGGTFGLACGILFGLGSISLILILLFVKNKTPRGAEKIKWK